MLEIKNLCLFYGDNKILEDISIKVSDGECVLLTGPSGSGKSSIINSINGLAYKYENASIRGNIKINGEEIRNLKLYEISLIIASVFQNPKTHFFNVNTTLELLFYLENIGLSRENMDERMEEMLKVFHIEHLIGRSIFELSGGEKQILCVASCYISGCKIIVLDEPSANLDDKYIDILANMIEILKRNGATIIIAEHQIYYLMNLVDSIYVINRGRVIESFGKEEFLSLESNDLIKFGIRSREKMTLIKNEIPKEKNLIIKIMNIEFEDKHKLILENISFALGSIYGIVGENGCGKSTFLREMVGLNKNDRSKIIFEGKNLNKKDRLKNSSLVMQDVNHQLFTDSVEKELKLGIENLSSEKIEEVLMGLDIINLRDKHPMSLSGGEKQRVAIASVLCKNSKFIFFDEPTSGMDYGNMLKISKMIKKMKKEDNIIFIVSHDIEFLNATTDYNIYLDKFNG